MKSKKTTPCLIASLKGKDEVLVKLVLPTLPKKFSGLLALPDRQTAGLPQGLPSNGRQVLTNAKMVGIRKLWPTLVNAGLFFLEIYKEPKERGMSISLVFARISGEDEPATIPAECIMEVNDLTSYAWQYCHAFDNPDRSVSVVAIMPINQEPLRTLYVEDHQLGILTLPDQERVYTGKIDNKTRESARH